MPQVAGSRDGTLAVAFRQDASTLARVGAAFSALSGERQGQAA